MERMIGAHHGGRPVLFLEDRPRPGHPYRTSHLSLTRRPGRGAIEIADGGGLGKQQTGPFRTESTPQPFRYGTNPVYVLCNVQVSALVPESGKNYVICLTCTLGVDAITVGNPLPKIPYFLIRVVERTLSIYL